MKIYIFFSEQDCIMLSISDPDLIEDDNLIIIPSISKGKLTFEFDIKFDEGISEQKSEEIANHVSRNYGHDLISPIVISKVTYRNYNIKSVEKMIENFRTLESANVKDLDMGRSGMTGVIITLK